MTQAIEAIPAAKTDDVHDGTPPQLRELRAAICDRIAIDLRRDGELAKDDATRTEVRRRVEEFLRAGRPNLDQAAREMVMFDVMNELFGFGPIQPLLDDPTVTEVMVNRADRVYASATDDRDARI